MDHHSFEVLHQNTFGYLAQCPDCNRVQCGMGNVVHTMSVEEFFCLKDAIQSICQKLEDNTIQEVEYPLSDGRTILLKSPLDNMLFSFYREELGLFCDLLSKAHLMITAKDLLSNLNKPA